MPSEAAPWEPGRRYSRVVEVARPAAPLLSSYFPKPQDSTTTALIKLANLSAGTSALLSTARGTGRCCSPESSATSSESAPFVALLAVLHAGLLLAVMSQPGRRVAGFASGFTATFPLYLTALSAGALVDFSLSRSGSGPRTFQHDLP